MSFHTFVKNITISAADFDDNYKWIRQTDVLPRGGSSLDPTTNVYNLGDVSYRWKTCYADQLTVMGEINPTSSMTLVSEFTLTQTASSIEITGLTGESDSNYRIIYKLKCINTAGSINLVINNDSSTCYFWEYVELSGLTALYSANTKIPFGYCQKNTTSSHNIYGEMQMTSKSGLKMYHNKYIEDSQDLYIRYVTMVGGSANIAAAISTIKIYGAENNMLLTSCNIQIYAMR